MNIFIIPSWYPSVTDPLPGIFFQEQALALAKHYPELNIGISTWGQNDQRLLMWSKEPFKSLTKLLAKPKLSKKPLKGKKNVIEYFNPAFTWNTHILNGNIKQISQCNLLSLHEFERAFGKADLIHAHVGFPAGYIAKIISETTKIPYVITEHMSPFPHTHLLESKNNLDNRLKKAYKKAAKIISVSRSLNHQMTSFGLENITTISNPVDESFFKPSSFFQQNEVFTFFSLGRMAPQKGIDILLRAFTKIRFEARLRIGGDGLYLKEYQKLAHELGIAHKIQWLGQLDKNNALIEFQHCDAFVLPSRHESMGIVFVEAMACGKPVIGSICGGPEEFIHDATGYLVSPEDEDGLTIALEKMIANYQNFNPKILRKQFDGQFSSKVICQQIMKIYSRVTESYSKK